MGINLRRIVKFTRGRRDKSWLIPKYEWPAQDPEIDADQLEWQAEQELEKISANLWRYQQLRLGNKAAVERADAANARTQRRVARINARQQAKLEKPESLKKVANEDWPTRDWPVTKNRR